MIPNLFTELVCEYVRAANEMKTVWLDFFSRFLLSQGIHLHNTHQCYRCTVIPKVEKARKKRAPFFLIDVLHPCCCTFPCSKSNWNAHNVSKNHKKRMILLYTGRFFPLRWSRFSLVVDCKTQLQLIAISMLFVCQCI